ncbi:MAG: Gfo/Idh/MocA family protein [Thermomicrobiales bacterium]
MDTLRVGIVGAGWMGHAHARAWQENAPRGAIVAIADVSPERARHLAAQLSEPNVPNYPDLASMLAEADIDAVDICLPHHLHTGAILAAARAGKAVLCEKPLCTTLSDAAAIRDALQESGSVFMAAHNQLFQPSLIEARRLLGSGALGKPFVFRSIEAVQNRGFAAGRRPVEIGGGESPWVWRADVKRMGGGEVIDTGWHATYRLLALGDERPVEVTAMMDRFAVQQLTAEDTGVLLVRFASGAIGEMLTSWAFSPVGSWHFEVGAEHGSLAGGKTSLVHQLHGWPEPVAFGPFTHDLALTFASEVAHFLDVVQRGEPSLASFEHAARVLQLTLAAYTAAAEHCVVSLPEDPTQPGIPMRQSELAEA